jgi:hypothetical protein
LPGATALQASFLAWSSQNPGWKSSTNFHVELYEVKSCAPLQRKALCRERSAQASRCEFSDFSKLVKSCRKFCWKTEENLMKILKLLKILIVLSSFFSLEHLEQPLWISLAKSGCSRVEPG